MTYGWAILVVLAAIGALAYFGVLSPSNFLPAKCVASPGISCIDKPQVTTSYIAQTFTPNLGFSLTTASLATSVVGTSTNSPIICTLGDVTCVTSVSSLNDGTSYTLKVPGPFQSGQSIKETITMVYKNPNSQLDETYIIELTGKAS
jgi:hypothetical protein